MRVLERVRLTLARDKNRASVIVWSVGNENPVTPITIAAGRLAGRLDPTRPWTFPMIPGVFRKWISGENPLAAENQDIPLIYDWHYPILHAQNLRAFASLREVEAPAFSLRFDRRMTITKRTAMESGESSRKKRDAALAKGKKWKPGRKEAPVKDLVLPRIQDAKEGEIVCTETNGAYLVRYSFCRDAAWDSAEAGVCFDLPKETTEFRWQGMGPYEAYPKRDLLVDFGVWHLNKDDLYFPGNRPQVTAAIVCDKSGAGYLVLPATDGETLNVAVASTARRSGSRNMV